MEDNCWQADTVGVDMSKEEREPLQFRANLTHKTQNPESTTVWNYVVRDTSKDDSEPLRRGQAMFDSYQT